MNLIFYKFFAFQKSFLTALDTSKFNLIPFADTKRIKLRKLCSTMWTLWYFFISFFKPYQWILFFVLRVPLFNHLIITNFVHELFAAWTFMYIIEWIYKIANKTTFFGYVFIWFFILVCFILLFMDCSLLLHLTCTNCCSYCRRFR